MYVRAIALALPLLAGIACSTTRSERSAQTASTDTARKAGDTSGSTAAATPDYTSLDPDYGSPGATKPGSPPASGTSPDATASGSATSTSPSGSTGSTTTPDATTPDATASGSATSTSPSDSTASGSTGSTTTPDATTPDSTTPGSPPATGTTPDATASGSASQDPLMQPGDEVKAHASDQVVSGKIAKVSRRSISIRSDAGEQKTLQLAPETQIVIEGQDAQRSQLREGQEVRASFNEVDGRDVAVEVHVGGTGSSGSSGSSFESGSSSSGSSSSMDEAKPPVSSQEDKQGGAGSTSGDTGTRSPTQR